MIGATGAAEIIFSSIMLEKGFVSPTINCENPDPEFSDVDIPAIMQVLSRPKK